MLKLEQLELCSSEIKEMKRLQRIFKDINDHYERVLIGDIDDNDCMIEITIDNGFFISHTSHISHELICKTLFEIFKINIELCETKDLIVDAKLTDLCEKPYFNRYGLIRSMENGEIIKDPEQEKQTIKVFPKIDY